MATDTEKVRALIGDDEVPYTFTDETIGIFLEMYDGSVYRAGGNLLLRAAVDVGLTAKMVRTDDLTVDTTKKADVLYKRAELLLGQADADDATDSTFALSFFPSAIGDSARHAPEGVPFWAY